MDKFGSKDGQIYPLLSLTSVEMPRDPLTVE